MNDDRAPVEESIHVEDNAPYIVVIARPGQEEVRYEVPRNLIRLYDTIEEALKEDTLDEQSGIEIRVALQGNPVHGINENAVIDRTQTVEATLPDLSGSANNVLAAVSQQIITPEQALLLFEKFVGNLSMISDITAAILTVVSQTKGVGGKSVTNTALTVDDADIIKLVNGAAGHVETFKMNMKRKGVEFPDDTKIIMPWGT